MLSSVSVHYLTSLKTLNDSISMAWYSLFYSEAYAVNKSLDTSMFGVKNTSSSSTSVLFWLAGVVVLLLVLILAYRWLNIQRIKRANQRYLLRRAKVQQQEIELSEDASFRIVALAKAVNTVPEKLLSSNTAFEKAVEKLKKLSPSDPLIMKIPGLREDLGYIFFNRRANFICTQMLQTGQKLRVSVNFKGKSHSYVGTILNSTEDEFWVKPPTVKGKTVNLSKFKSFDFSIFRKNDGEYRFSSILKSQITTPIHALVMAHVNKIKKLHIREHDRYSLQFKRQFFFVHGNRKIQAAGNTDDNMQCVGTVVDISIGGMKFSVNELPERVTEGVKVIFRLEEAKIRNEINAEIVRITDEGTMKSVHLQFQELSELNRLYLQKFIASKNPIKIK